MTPITDIATLDDLYGAAVPASLDKVCDRITPLYRQWIEASRFVVMSTVGPEGCDGSPRGDAGPVSQIMDEKTLIMPDWRGNNRLDTLKNIVRDPRTSLMFMVPGSPNVVRVNGRAIVTADDGLTARFDKGGKRPRTVIVLTIGEVYFQCAKAIIRSNLWSGEDESGLVPTAGQFIKEFQAGFDAQDYDEAYVTRSKPKIW